MAEAVYLLCALTSLACAVLLWRGYARSRMALTFWTCVCFACLTVNNVLLFVDLAVLPAAVDLSMYRNLTGLLGAGMLLYGLITSEAS